MSYNLIKLNDATVYIRICLSCVYEVVKVL